ncbi:lytic murein transglycosylase B, partial [Xanthomonas hortorum pv. gardneri]
MIRRTLTCLLTLGLVACATQPSLPTPPPAASAPQPSLPTPPPAASAPPATPPLAPAAP